MVSVSSTAAGTVLSTMAAGSSLVSGIPSVGATSVGLEPCYES